MSRRQCQMRAPSVTRPMYHVADGVEPMAVGLRADQEAAIEVDLPPAWLL